MSKQLTVADFFCGAGGFSEGFRQKGFKIIFSLDNWKPAAETHDLNHTDSKTVCMNILELDTMDKIEEVFPQDTDVIVGSPPCVSFSYSNKAGKADKTLGIKLIKQFLKIILWKRYKSKGKLKYRIMENVPNSRLHINKSYTWEELGLPGKNDLFRKRNKWGLKWPSSQKDRILEIPIREILLASDYGAPQNRKRFVCGDYPMPKKNNNGEKEVQINDVISALNNKNRIKDPIYGFTIPKKELTDHFYNTMITEYEWKRAKMLKEDHGFMGKMDFPERTDRTCRTVTATQSASTRESIIFGKEKNKKGEWISYRLPTIREISCFMGFPINYQFEGKNEAIKYKLVGNAVCPPMSAALAEAILKELGEKSLNLIEKKTKLAKVNLNGTERKERKKNPKSIKTRYARHIPYLKIMNLRVELSNRKSNFEKGKYIWESNLHRGTGRNAKVQKIDNLKIKMLIGHYSEFKKFVSEIENIYDKTISYSQEKKENYFLLSKGKYFNPDELLEHIKLNLDIHLPQKDFDMLIIENNGIMKNRKTGFPIRILAGLYALNSLIFRLI